MNYLEIPQTLPVALYVFGDRERKDLTWMELGTAGTPKTEWWSLLQSPAQSVWPTGTSQWRRQGRDSQADVSGDLLPRCPLPNLSPSHCLEIDHGLTARRQPSYGVLTVPSCPLLERRWRSSSALSSSAPPLHPWWWKSRNHISCSSRGPGTVEKLTTHTHRALHACPCSILKYSLFKNHILENHIETHTKAERLNTIHLSFDCYVNNIQVFSFFCSTCLNCGDPPLCGKLENIY